MLAVKFDPHLIRDQNKATFPKQLALFNGTGKCEVHLFYMSKLTPI
jgi:hypothetical protein